MTAREREKVNQKITITNNPDKEKRKQKAAAISFLRENPEEMDTYRMVSATLENLRDRQKKSGNHTSYGMALKFAISALEQVKVFL